MAVFSNFLKAAELEIEAYPLLDELTSKISTLNLERVRRLKSRLVALTRRVQKVIPVHVSCLSFLIRLPFLLLALIGCTGFRLGMR